MSALTFFILVTIGAVVIFNLGYQVGTSGKTDAPAPRVESERQKKSYEVKAERYFGSEVK